MEVLAVIPARGGSVRTPKKNIKMLGGKPLIAYAIEAAKQSKYITRIVVSTDDDEIRGVALKYGGIELHERPSHLTGDCPTEDVIIDTVESYQEIPYIPDIVVCLEPPQPFRTAKHIDICVAELQKHTRLDSIVTISEVQQRPEWMVRLKGDLFIEPYTDYFNAVGGALLKVPASQELEELYYVDGVVFACRTKTLLKYKSLVGVRCAGVIIDRKDTFDLNYPQDFEICEMIMQKRNT